MCQFDAFTLRFNAQITQALYFMKLRYLPILLPFVCQYSYSNTFACDAAAGTMKESAELVWHEADKNGATIEIKVPVVEGLKIQEVVVSFVNLEKNQLIGGANLSLEQKGSSYSGYSFVGFCKPVDMQVMASYIDGFGCHSSFISKYKYNKLINYAREKHGPDAASCAGY